MEKVEKSALRIEGEALLDAMPQPVLTLTAGGAIGYANNAAQEFFGISLSVLRRRKAASLFPYASPVTALIEKCIADHAPFHEFGVALERPPEHKSVLIDLHITPLETESETMALLVVQLRSIAQHIDRQLTHRGAARQVEAMAAMLAHEIKNPLSGIRGAAQLLEADIAPSQTELTQLICSETDRITALVAQFEQFGDTTPQLKRVNIHEILGRVRLLAESGFASHVQFSEDYDPSLPNVLGDKDLLIQAFLNLVKNAAEAVAQNNGRITLRSAFRPGVRLSSALGDAISLPLEFSVIDNGVGIAEDLQPHLFEAFVSTKTGTTQGGGRGLGLALVAKIIGEHGGTIECDTSGGQTAFHIRLPLHKEQQ